MDLKTLKPYCRALILRIGFPFKGSIRDLIGASRITDYTNLVEYNRPQNPIFIIKAY